MKNEWLMKIIVPNSNKKFTIYSNGFVYGTNYNHKLFMLNDKSINKIKYYIRKDIYMLKTLSYVKMRRSGLIIKINDNSRKNRNIKVIGWAYEKKIIDILCDKENYKKIF